MPRICIFCQQQTSGAGHGEHLFPNWLNRVFENIPQIPTSVGATRWENSTVNMQSGELSFRSWPASQIASVTTKLVCNSCNTGWMSDLECRAAPLLIPMIEGRPHTLSQAEQLIVATWSTKTAMVLEPVVGAHEYFRQEQRDMVRIEDRPPGFFRVYAAAIEGLVSPLSYSRVVGRQELPNQGFFDLHMHTVQINTLVLQVSRSEPPPPKFGVLMSPAISSIIEVPVFPPSDFFWPPERSLSTNSIGGYAAGYRQL